MLGHYYTDDNIFGENWFSYPNLYKKVVEKFPSGSKFVEVGCWEGRSSSYLAVEIINSQKDIELYCVDTWEGSVEHQNGAVKESLSSLYQTFIDNMKPVEEYYIPLKLSSEIASKKFKDKSLDFVFLDGSHEYEDVKLDIQNWLPKIKPGGILAGHDYYFDPHTWFPGVKKAVDEEFTGFSTSEDCWIYEVPRATNKEKMKNFPSINFISIEESVERRNLLYKKFEEYDLHNVTPHIFKKYDDSEHVVKGELIDNIVGSGRAPTTSHLKAIKDWYLNTDEEYTVFCEDDLSLETVKYWNFTWEEFFNSLPKDWECVQLCWVREEDSMFSFLTEIRPRCWCDWSACAYLIKRSHAKKLISHYYRNGEFTLDYTGTDYYERPDWALLPVVETILFSNFSNAIYGFPLFCEDTENCDSTMIDLQYKFNTRHWNIYSYNAIMDWWKNTGKHLSLFDLTSSLGRLRESS